MTKKISPERVVRVLEGLCLIDIDIDTATEKELKIFADKVYMFCHLTRDTCCSHNHDSWREEFEKNEKYIIESIGLPKN